MKLGREKAETVMERRREQKESAGVEYGGGIRNERENQEALPFF